MVHANVHQCVQARRYLNVVRPSETLVLPRVTSMLISNPIYARLYQCFEQS